AWNGAFKCHRDSSITCDDPEFIILKETKWGVCWQMTLQCRKCKFNTPEYKLYKEVPTKKPGPNAGAPNIGLGIGLQDTPVGNTRARLMLANMDAPPPARSSMQITSSIVSEKVTELNKKDMSAKLQLVGEINKERGNDPTQINIAMDGRYNSTTIVSRKKPGQNASHAIGLA
ncbi:hypothetical protein ScPMuIL_004524, partial [Solemya velum]